MDTVIQPIEAAVNDTHTFVQTLKTFFDGLSFGRRLEELTPADMVHARGLKEHAHRQLAEVRGRLLHADTDHARDGTKERLQLDINRRLEAHFAERKLTARRLEGELITINKLKVRISLNLASRLLIEGEMQEDYTFSLIKQDIDDLQIFILSNTPFFVKLATSFSVDCSLEVKVEADFKALVHVVVNRMAVDFDLSTDAGERAVLSEGDWTHTIT